MFGLEPGKTLKKSSITNNNKILWILGSEIRNYWNYYFNICWMKERKIFFRFLFSPFYVLKPTKVSNKFIYFQILRQTSQAANIELDRLYSSFVKMCNSLSFFSGIACLYLFSYCCFPCFVYCNIIALDSIKETVIDLHLFVNDEEGRREIFVCELVEMFLKCDR